MPGFGRRLLSMIYESLILVAVLFIAGFVFHLVFQNTNSIFFSPRLSNLSPADRRYLFHLVLDPRRADTTDADLEASGRSR